MKTIHPFLILLLLASGLLAQPANPADAPAKPAIVRTTVAPTNPATAVLPPTNVVVDLTAPAAPAVPAITPGIPPSPEATAPPTRVVRTPTATATTNPPAEAPPAFPAFPTLPTPRRAVTPAAAGTGAGGAGPGNAAIPPVNTAVPPGGAADPANPANVLGKPAAAGTTPTATGANPAVKTEEEEPLGAGEIKFQDAELLQVLKIYQELTGRTIIRPTSLPPTKISVETQTPLTRREAVQLLDTILAMNGITMIPQGTKFVKAVAEGQAAIQGAEFQPEDGDLENTTRYITKIIRLKNALPREVGPVLQQVSKLPNSIIGIDSSSILVIRDYEENIKRMEELLQEIDVVPNNEYEPIIIPIKYALAGDIAQVLSSLAGGGGATSVGGRQAATGLSTTPGLQQSRGGAGGIGGGFGGAGGIQGQQYGNPGAGGIGGAAGGGFGSPAATRSSFQQRLSAIVNRAASGSGDIVVIGNTKIIADERTNSLLIFATKGDMDTITNIIAKLDVVLAQVVIEAIIMEVALDNKLNYGFSYIQTKASGGDNVSGIGGINNGTFLTANNFRNIGSNAVTSLPSGFSYFTKFGDFEATATAIATDNRINVLSRPRIQTSHAVEANLFVGETRPYITGTYSYLGSGPSSQYSQLQIGITLSVLPLINQDGLVVMDIRQKIQSIGGTTKIDNNDIPITIDREANAKVAVRDRETVMLGGFISSDRSKSSSGVPLLKDLPLLGMFFRSTTKDSSRKELMILIRPTVLPTPQIAALVATDMKSKLPGITAAEEEVRREERRQASRLKVQDTLDEKQLERDELRDQRRINRMEFIQPKTTDQEIYKREGFQN